MYVSGFLAGYTDKQVSGADRWMALMQVFFQD
jgi:hypothetical protein